MSTDTTSVPDGWFDRNAPGVRLNRSALVLMGLMVAVQLVAGAIALHVQQFPLELPAWLSENSNSAAGGGGLAAVVVVESLVLVAAWRGWKRLPERWRSVVRTGVRALVWGFAGVAVGALAVVSAYGMLIGVVSVESVLRTWLPWVVLVGAYSYLDVSNDFAWLFHNAAAFVLCVAVVGLFGLVLGPVAAIAFMVVAAVWDYVAVFKSDLMADLVDFSAAQHAPNYFIVPTTLRVDYEAVRDYLSDDASEKPAGVAALIGTGDFVFPSLFVVALALQYGVVSLPPVAAAAGVVVSIGVLQAALEARESALPALPWVNSGAIGGYAVGLAVVMVV